MSESLTVGILMAISGGLMDAYSYLYRGHVFANAQTGNVLLFSIYLSKGERIQALHYAFPIVAFLSGVALSTFICHFGKHRDLLHWRQICVLLEAVIFFTVAGFSQNMNLPANCLISLACCNIFILNPSKCLYLNATSQRNKAICGQVHIL